MTAADSSPRLGAIPCELPQGDLIAGPLALAAALCSCTSAALCRCSGISPQVLRPRRRHLVAPEGWRLDHSARFLPAYWHSVAQCSRPCLDCVQLGLRSPVIAVLRVVWTVGRGYLRSLAHAYGGIQRLLDGAPPFRKFLVVLLAGGLVLLRVSVSNDAASGVLFRGVVLFRSNAAVGSPGERPHTKLVLAPSSVLILGQSAHPIRLRPGSRRTVLRYECDSAARSPFQIPATVVSRILSILDARCCHLRSVPGCNADRTVFLSSLRCGS